MNKKYVRKEVVTITRTEEFSIVDNDSAEEPASNSQLVSMIWKLIKKYIFSYKWLGGGKDG